VILIIGYFDAWMDDLLCHSVVAHSLVTLPKKTVRLFIVTLIATEEKLLTTSVKLCRMSLLQHNTVAGYGWDDLKVDVRHDQLEPGHFRHAPARRAHVFMIWIVTLWRAGIRLRAMLSSAIVNVVVKTSPRMRSCSRAAAPRIDDLLRSKSPKRVICSFLDEVLRQRNVV